MKKVENKIIKLRPLHHFPVSVAKRVSENQLL